MDSIVGRQKAKAKEIYSAVTQGQENAVPFLASADWLKHFKRKYGANSGKLSGKVGSANLEKC